MTYCVDLHSHTDFSDGRLTPEELLLLAARQGVDILALTDHDTTEGIPRAQIAAAKYGVHLIPGVEISCQWRGQVIHLLGFNIDIYNSILQQGLLKIRNFRYLRAQAIAEKLNNYLKVKDMLKEVVAHAKNKENIARPHFAQVLVDRGHARHMQEAFKKYLLPGKPGFVALDAIPLEEAVTWIIQAGGIACIAHPLRYSFKLKRLTEMVEEFKRLGGQAIEVVAGTSKLDEITKMAELAQKLGLYASIGSDYHGMGLSWCAMGRTLPLPKECRSITELWS